ncbi:MAG: hypothetical protein GKR89_31920 [Candidatus Latescibacteria bacterium]|nr:hypothetical protein [Candidatus Latescibacterota bacterium]
MFGEHPNPPKPPKYEPVILVAIAVGIAVLITLGYVAVIYLSDRAAQGGAG